MKKIIFCLLFSLAITYVSAQSFPKMKNDADSVSFFIGMDIARTVKTMPGVEFNHDMIAKGLSVGLGLPEDYDLSEHIEFLRDYFMVRIPQKALRETEAYLETIAANPNVKRTESGLLYEIIEEGDMNYRATEDTDGVEVTYIGKLPDGTVFDENDEGITFQLNRVIRGWTEGLKLVGKGGRIILYVHPDQGYGAQGSMGVIPSNSALVFDVTVLDAPDISDPSSAVSSEPDPWDY